MPFTKILKRGIILFVSLLDLTGGKMQSKLTRSSQSQYELPLIPQTDNRAQILLTHEGNTGKVTIPCADWYVEFKSKLGGFLILKDLYEMNWIDHALWLKWSTVIHESEIPSTGTGEVSIFQGGKIIGFLYA